MKVLFCLIMCLLLCACGEVAVLPSETVYISDDYFDFGESDISAEPIIDINEDLFEEDEPKSDSERFVTVLLGETVTEMSLDVYLYGVVAGEMPASFPYEALKAQAVAARTYTLYKQAHITRAHPDAQVCGNSSCCKAYSTEETLRKRWDTEYDKYSEIIKTAVDATDSIYIEYEEEPILAVFHSTSAGKTERSADVWGADLPYLQSVESPGEEDAPRYSATVTMTPAQFKKKLVAAYPKIKLSSSVSKWLGAITRSTGGGVLSVKLGNTTLSGGEMRKIFGLNSTDFTITISKKAVVIETMGYGHRVGMSQYGARALALDGKNFEEILCYYYLGCRLALLP